MSTELILTEIDDSRTDDPKHYRLVCKIDGGGKLAVWGRDGNTANVAQVRQWIDDHGFPLTISCVWTEPEEWASKKYGHTHWLAEGDVIKRL
jgi:hypothetical protein